METKSKKFDVAVSVTSPHQEGDKSVWTKVDETPDFRETIQIYIEQNLASLQDVEIIDNDIQNGWDYFIQIVFFIYYRQRKNKPHLPFVKLSVCFYDSETLVGLYRPAAEPTKDQLCEVCKDLVIDFNRQYFEPARRNVHV